MSVITFLGVVLPERAPLNHNWDVELKYIEIDGVLKLSGRILLNQILVRLIIPNDFDLMTLRNIVSYNIKLQLSMFAFLRGFSYEHEITRAYSEEMNIDYVFGVDTPEINERRSFAEIERSYDSLLILVSGERGIYIARCLDSLHQALNNAEDCGFHCYRAIESLQKHLASAQGKAKADSERIRWDNFRRSARVERSKIDSVKAFADEVRHGGFGVMSGIDREALLRTTWDIIDSYFMSLEPKMFSTQNPIKDWL